MSKQYEIRIGFFADFHDPALLIWGSAEGLSRLARLLRSSGEAGKAEMSLTEEPWISPVHDVRLTLEISELGRGMRVRESDREFCCSLLPAEARDFADKIDVLAKASGPGHHYLDAGTKDDCVVMVSIGEYDKLLPD